MGKGACTFKETDVTRALRAAKKAGVDVQVQIDLEHKTMTLTPVKASEAETGKGKDLDKWINEHAGATEGH
jgi:hypothetical protein